jgi:DNA-binding response OmpR family regulator
MGTAAERLPERVILVVDDEALVCRMMARVLTEAGFRVLEAHDGEEAATLLGTLGPGAVGLVVSDISMPRMDGLALAGLAAERWPTVPVLLLSGRGGPPTGYPGHFIPKPFTSESLLAAVRHLLPPPLTRQEPALH